MVCNRCQKRPAIIFVQRMENGQMKMYFFKGSV